MKDFFPMSPPKIFTSLQPIFNTLHLQALHLHLHEILLSFLFYSLIFICIAPLSTYLFPTFYTPLPGPSKVRWATNCISMIQSCSICLLALYVLLTDTERSSMNLQERIWEYSGSAALVQALGTGYFLFELVFNIRYLRHFGVGMLAHASSCLLIYTLGFRPIFNYYGPIFMLYELSTPFLNIHWFFDKFHMTGSNPQYYNGLLLIFVFFCCRFVWGAYFSYKFYSDVWNALNLVYSVGSALDGRVIAGEGGEMGMGERAGEMMRLGGNEEMPVWLVGLYMSGHIVVNCLNVLWFGKMIKAIRKRFVKKEGKEVMVNGNGNGIKTNGVMGNGVKSNGIEVHGVNGNRVKKE